MVSDHRGDDLFQVKVVEYTYKDDTLYSRSKTWNEEKKIPSLLRSLMREDKTGKVNNSENDGYSFTLLSEKRLMQSPISS